MEFIAVLRRRVTRCQRRGPSANELAARIGDPLPLILLWTTAGAFVVIGASLHRRMYMPGFTKSQEGANAIAGRATWQRAASRLLGWLPVTRREFILKDLRVFFRTPRSGAS
jgi:hypothetical protein